MKQEFEMKQEEMDKIITINKDGGDPVMFLSGGQMMGSSKQEKINQYWEILGEKYGFKPLTVEGSSKGSLYFLAEPKPIVIPKTSEEIAVDEYVGNAMGYLNYNVVDSLKKIINQLEKCEYESIGGFLINNVAFTALKKLAKLI